MDKVVVVRILKELVRELWLVYYLKCLTEDTLLLWDQSLVI